MLGTDDSGKARAGYCGTVRVERRQNTTPRPMTPFKNIAAGYFHCVAVASDGSVYTWGANEGGQFGHGNDHDIYSVPTRVDHLEDAKSSSAGKSSCC